MKSLALIPARGGSKRIPRKNIREFCGKPMIAWSIEAARSSGCFSRIVVSTDDPEIAAMAVKYGAEAPFKRPHELADDHAPTVSVVAHAVEELGMGADQPVCCLYATAPFICSEDLHTGEALLVANPDAFVVPVTTYAYPIQRALRRHDGGELRMMRPEMATVRSQDLEEAWHDAGQFYWAKARIWQSSTTVFSNNAVGFPIPRTRVQDIDTLEDWQIAERMMRLNE